MAKKNVTLKIINEQYSEKLEPKGESFERELTLEDRIEIDTEAVMYHRTNTTYIAYDEPEESGLDGSHTIIKMYDDALNIKRFRTDSADNTDMILREGQMNITKYETPAGNITLEIYTDKLTNNLAENGMGTIQADYHIKLEQLLNRRNKLEIEIRDN